MTQLFNMIGQFRVLIGYFFTITFELLRFLLRILQPLSEIACVILFFLNDLLQLNQFFIQKDFFLIVSLLFLFQLVIEMFVVILNSALEIAYSVI